MKIYVEDQDVRAVKGGTGTAKTGGNYAASLRAGDRAEAQGYSQVLWLDGVHRKYIEEVGSMNVMFKVAGKILTPDLNGSVLDGITRRSCIQLLKDWGYEVEERRISAEELFEAAEKGELEEAWGTGTAAVGGLGHRHRRRGVPHRRAGRGRQEGHRQQQPDRPRHSAPVRRAHRHPVGPPARSPRLDYEAVLSCGFSHEIKVKNWTRFRVQFFCFLRGGGDGTPSPQDQDSSSSERLARPIRSMTTSLGSRPS